MTFERSLILAALLTGACTHTRPIGEVESVDTPAVIVVKGRGAMPVEGLERSTDGLRAGTTTATIPLDDVLGVRTVSTTQGLLDGALLGTGTGLGVGAIVGLSVWLRGQQGNCEEGATSCFEVRLGPRLPIVLGVATTLLGAIVGTIIGAVEGGTLVYERP